MFIRCSVFTLVLKTLINVLLDDFLSSSTAVPPPHSRWQCALIQWFNISLTNMKKILKPFLIHTNDRWTRINSLLIHLALGS